MTEPLRELSALGQSVWYDNLSREVLRSGALQRMVEQDGIRGVTSNPAIFQKALAAGKHYDEQLRELVTGGASDAGALFEQLAIRDIQAAADVLRPVYAESGRHDGFVSLEVSPYLAKDTAATIDEARRLWSAVGRENLMIKVPGTPEGLPAIEELISEGISVNTTLLFSVDVYEQVATAYMSGLERLAARGGDLSRVAGVASFFVSRIDSKVDGRIARELEELRDPDRKALLERLAGKVAIANARRAYALYQKLVAGARWQALEAKGAVRQRVLWASTSTKNPEYSKTLYVDSLIAPETVNTIPAATLDAVLAWKRLPPAMTDDWERSLAQAEETLDRLEEAGISLRQVTDELTEEGVQLFADAFDELLGAVEGAREQILGSALASQQLFLGREREAVDGARDEWRRSGRVRRLWQRDASLWSGGREDRWLGWLDAVSDGLREAGALDEIAARVDREQVRHVLVLGMGGSSLCPDLLSRTFPPAPGFPELRVLDSTVPAQVRRVASELDLEHTLFVVSSKSGSTIEPNCFMAHFFEALAGRLGREAAAKRFVAITDPRSALETHATREGFLAVAHGDPSIGGRFSALSPFGMLPARLMGIDATDFLRRAQVMVDACAASVPPARNPGVALGLALGTLAQRGRDKLSFVATPGLASLGAWLEQLVAESTGKRGIGIVPVDGEEVGAPEVYGDDRVFVHLRLATDASAGQQAALAVLEEAGHPVLRVELEDPLQLGQEFFRWEIATAVAGAVLGIDPFDQPDVEAAKVAARELVKRYEESGALPEETPLLEEAGLRFSADAGLARAPDAASLLAAHLGRIQPGDYFAINAYLDRSDVHVRALQELRQAVRDAKRVATCVGFGPRFLHSTGQLHKGGPNRGVFLQITADDAHDLPVPGQRASFGVLAAAQARGDFQVLCERDRRILHVHCGPDAAGDLARLGRELRSALGDAG
jgi:transaldolase/glucose-6-phosphate isomerase